MKENIKSCKYHSTKEKELNNPAIISDLFWKIMCVGVTFLLQKPLVAYCREGKMIFLFVAVSDSLLGMTFEILNSLLSKTH